MKILHLGDLHLGKALSEYSLIEDQKYILDQILDIISEKRVDAVLTHFVPENAAGIAELFLYGERGVVCDLFLQRRPSFFQHLIFLNHF